MTVPVTIARFAQVVFVSLGLLVCVGVLHGVAMVLLAVVIVDYLPRFESEYL